ncbi:MAG: GNAT family N-acetyltransferase [Clostridia bacterium]|nr:GNAT family N-acetyltransferase [Clostridia bacterium]
MTIREVKPEGEVLKELIRLSGECEAENNCRGYRENGPADIEGRRVFVCEENDRIVGYLFGITERVEKDSSVAKSGEEYFELEELYVVPEMRSKGIGRELFRYAEEALKNEVGLIMLSTAAKDAKRILKFYLEDNLMDFWSARLFKRIK